MPHLPRWQSRCCSWNRPVANLILGAFFMGSVFAAQTDDNPGSPKITAVRFWSMGDVTRVIVESTGDFHYKFDRLHNPERVFFDLVGTRPQIGVRDAKGVSYISVGDSLIRQIRVAETQRGVTRIVFDLTSDIDFSTSQLSNPERLIIEAHALGSAGAKSESARNVRFTPSSATLDFGELYARRMKPVRLFVLDPPPPFDPTLRFATRPYNGPDPIASMSWAGIPPLPRYSRPLYVPPRPAQVALVSKPTITMLAPPMAGGGPVANSPMANMPATIQLSTPSAHDTEDRGSVVGLPAKGIPEETMIRVLGLKLGRIVIDPGHGGNDGGTSGAGGLREKDVVLDVAKRLEVLIKERLGSEVILTRTNDSFVPLSRRTAIANEKKADLFLSIHVNSSPIRSISGVETYYLSLNGSKAALETAMRENAGSDKNISELQDLLKQIALKDKIDESKEFALRVQNGLLALNPKRDRGAKDRGIKRAPFVVLIGASMPSILAEVGFISNSQEEGLMRRAEYRQKLAEALYRGVAAYAASLSHFQVARQQDRVAQKSADGQ